MLVRVNSAVSGIKDYLETGRKRGREFDRDLIDLRIPLTGNIELLEAVIDTIHTKQKGDAKYLHLTIGFAEQFTNAETCGPGQINAAVIQEVVEAYREALMVAYDSSEYLFYSEAHIPKVTHELNALTGEYVTRLPHVHIVIPYRNLESDRFLNPFGWLQNMTVPFALQEQINRRFGLKSPQASRRDPVSPQHPLGKHNNSFEGQSPTQIRTYLASLVEDNYVNTFDELIEAASQIGVVSVRKGRSSEYLNVKPSWADRGINIQGLDRDAFSESSDRVSVGAEPVHIDAVFEEWCARGAFEARYVNSARLKKAYRAMTLAQRSAFLDERRAETAQRLALRDQSFEFKSLEPAGEILDQAINRFESDGMPSPSAENFEYRILQVIEKLYNRAGASAPMAARSLTDAELKVQADPLLVLRVAVTRYGIDISSYSTSSGRDGSPRIVYGGKQYNLGDFFTKHLKRPWAEARTILMECVEQPVDEDRGRNVSLGLKVPAESPRSVSESLRLAGEVIARAMKNFDPVRAANHLRHRADAFALDALFERMDGSAPKDGSKFTSEPAGERPELSDLAAVHADSTRAIRAALKLRRERQAMAAANSSERTERVRERRSKTVIETIAESTHDRSVLSERLNAETNPAMILAAAHRLYNVDPAEYFIGSGADGSPRIFHKNKQYNLGDFFTKHLNRPWSEAESVLRDCYHATNSDALPAADATLWRQFIQWRSMEVERLSARRASDGKAFRERVLQARAQYDESKAAAKALPSGQRAVEMARARAEHFIAQQVASERASSRDQTRVPNRNAHYRAFLIELASQGETGALAELRRIAPYEQEADAKISGERSQATFSLPSYSVDAQGAVTYRSPAGAIVRDSVQGVSVLLAEQGAYDAAIRVAIARYGKTLLLSGDARFKANVIEAARRTGLDLTLRDAARPDLIPTFVRGRNQSGFQRPDR